MIETVAKHRSLGIRRLLARHMARESGRKVMSPDNPRALARARLNKAGDRVPCAPGVAIEQIEYAGRPALDMRPADARAGAILFLHGGGYSLGSAQSHKPYASKLAAALNLRTVSLDYRLAPEHVYPAAVEDACDALVALREDTEGPLLVAGDSAGGGLTLSSVLAHRELGRPMPDGLFLISPWVDLSGSGESLKTRERVDPMLKPHFLTRGVELYLDGTDPTDPGASTLFADLSGLPPTLIQVGDHEILLDDSKRLYKRLKEAGVAVTCEIWEAMFHDFQLFGPLLPEADMSLRHVQDWARAHQL